MRHSMLGLVMAYMIACVPIMTSGADSPELGVLPDKGSPEVAWWRQSMETRDERLQWWREARFGMFIHWGVYAALGNEYKGRKGGGYAEHIQRVLKIPIPEYRREVAGIFNPIEFDADQWIRAAKEAGMGYFVITAKHHDGFAMWPSKVNSYNIAEATPFKRDPMTELREACRKYGLRFGFYYSHAFDWGEANGPGNDWDFQNPGGDRLIGGRNWWETTPGFIPKSRRYVDGKSIPQLLELIRNYDPDILWFDTPHKLPPTENLRILKAAREAGPRVVINGRLVRGWGDYDSTADRPAEFSSHEGDWEGIPTTNESYGWSRFDASHKPASHFIQLLAKAAARGGNLLMNVGPMGNGRFDPRDLEILQGIGVWWRVNGESIQGTIRTPLAVQAWGESTRKANVLYLHVFEWPRDGRLVVGGLKSGVKKAYPLANAKATSLKVRRLNPLDVEIEVPTTAPDKTDSVVVVECHGDITTDPARLLSTTVSANALRALDSQLSGRLSFGPGKRTDAYVQNWSRPEDSVSWPVRLIQAASFDVAATYDGQTQSAGSTFVIRIGTRELTGTVQAGTGQTLSLGRVSLKPGTFGIQVVPKEIKGGELMRLRGITLTPIKP